MERVIKTLFVVWIYCIVWSLLEVILYRQVENREVDNIIMALFTPIIYNAMKKAERRVDMDFMSKIMDAFHREYGEAAKFEEGETQVFELNDCTVIMSLKEGKISTVVIGDKPIKVDCTTGFFVRKEEADTGMAAVPITPEMKADMVDCIKETKIPGGGKDCNKCSVNKTNYHGKAFCEVEQIKEKILQGADAVTLDTEEKFRRLAEYEALGVTPEQIREMDRLYAEKCKEVAELEKRLQKQNMRHSGALQGVNEKINTIVTELERKGFEEPKGFSTLRGYIDDRIKELG